MRECLPEIHGGISAPGPPGVCSVFQFTRSLQGQGAEKTEISGGKSVGLAEAAHGHVRGGSFADAGDFTEAAEKWVGVDDSLEVDPAGPNGAG